MLLQSRMYRLISVVLLVLALSSCTTEDLIRMAFSQRGATQVQQDQAIRVASCESNLRPDAVSSGGSNWGLFQINRIHRARVERLGFAWDEMLLPWQNAVVAADIWAEQGWRPWSCARRVGVS